MTKNVITIQGKAYPVIFNFDTLMSFEEIVGKSYFESGLKTMKERMAIVYAAVITADEDTKLTVEEMKGQGDLEAINQIIVAFNTVMELAKVFFKIPTVVKDAEEEEDKPDEKGDDNPKN